jgi:hypothetical protein
MRSAPTTAFLLLLAGLVFQPVLSGGWRAGPAPPPPRMRAPEPRPAPQFPQRQPQYAEPQRPNLQMAPAFQPPRPSMSRGDAMRQAQERTGGGRVLGADPTENGEVSTVYVQQ